MNIALQNGQMLDCQPGGLWLTHGQRPPTKFIDPNYFASVSILYSFCLFNLILKWL